MNSTPTSTDSPVQRSAERRLVALFSNVVFSRPAPFSTGSFRTGKLNRLGGGRLVRRRTVEAVEVGQ